jgi:hypothetical protein
MAEVRDKVPDDVRVEAELKPDVCVPVADPVRVPVVECETPPADAL